jgi:hypothetical protein
LRVNAEFIVEWDVHRGRRALPGLDLPRAGA